jgi:hypothetical protein
MADLGNHRGGRVTGVPNKVPRTKPLLSEPLNTRVSPELLEEFEILAYLRGFTPGGYVRYLCERAVLEADAEIVAQRARLGLETPAQRRLTLGK